MSAKTKWPEGPYVVEQFDGWAPGDPELYFLIWAHAHGSAVARCDQWAGEKGHVDAEAVANLFAAAPELYEALKDCHMRLQTARDIGNAADDAALAKGRAALAKARGEQS